MEIINALSWQNKIAIADYGTMAFVFLIGLVAAMRAIVRNNLSTDAKRLCIGISLICLWGMTHQTFWFTRWYLYANADSRTQWFLDHSYLLMIPYTTAFVGGIFVAYALFRDKCLAHKFVSSRGYTWASGWLSWAIALIALWFGIYVVLP